MELLDGSSGTKKNKGRVLMICMLHLMMFVYVHLIHAYDQERFGSLARRGHLLREPPIQVL